MMATRTTVVGVFANRDAAEKAIRELQRAQRCLSCRQRHDDRKEQGTALPRQPGGERLETRGEDEACQDSFRR